MARLAAPKLAPSYCEEGGSGESARPGGLAAQVGRTSMGVPVTVPHEELLPIGRAPRP